MVGSGVIGTVYGSQLAAARHSVSVLEHSPRTDDVARRGLVIKDVTDDSAAVDRVVTAEVIADPRDVAYDLVLISVWADHLPSVFAGLRRLGGAPALLFFGNNPGGHSSLPNDLPGTVHLGFPGVGGSLINGTVEYVRIPRQPTTVEAGGGPAVQAFEAALSRQGFAVTRTSDMDGWLVYHSMFIGSVASALYRCHGSAVELSKDRTTLRLMCRSIEEGFQALAGQSVPGAPKDLRTLHRPLLRPVAIHYWARAMRSTMGERCFAAHARRAEPEMRSLAAATIDRLRDEPHTAHLHELLD